MAKNQNIDMEIGDLDNSNIKKADDSDLFMMTDQLEMLDRKFETELNLGDSILVSEKNIYKEKEGTNSKKRDDQRNNFTFNVQNSEIVFNKKKVEDVGPSFEKWQRKEKERKEKELLIYNITLSGMKKNSKENSELQYSENNQNKKHFLEEDSDIKKQKVSMENSLKNSNKASFFTKRGSSKQDAREQDSYQSQKGSKFSDKVLKEQSLGKTREESEQKILVHNRKRSKSPLPQKSNLMLQVQNKNDILDLVRENERLKIKNEQLKDLGKRMRDKNKERKEYIIELNVGLEEAIYTNDQMKLEMNEMEMGIKERDHYILELENALKIHKKIKKELSKLKQKAKAKVKIKNKMVSQSSNYMQDFHEFPKSDVHQKAFKDTEYLSVKDEARVKRILNECSLRSVSGIEELKAYEEIFFIFKILKNDEIEGMEVKLLNNTIYKEQNKNKLLATLLDKMYRGGNFGKFVKRFLFVKPKYLLLENALVDKILDSDFSEYLENEEEDEEMDDYDGNKIAMDYKPKRLFTETNKDLEKEKEYLFSSQSTTPNKTQKTQKSQKSQNTLNQKIKNKSKIRSQSSNKIQSERRRTFSKDPIKNENFQNNKMLNRIKKQIGSHKSGQRFGLLSNSINTRQKRKSKIKKNKKEIYYSQMNLQNDNETEENLCKSSLYNSVTKIRIEKASGEKERKQIFELSQSSSSNDLK